MRSAAKWLFTGIIAVLSIQADASEFYGLLRTRDLTPFGFLRLDMRPAHAVTLQPETWAFEAELGYQNTWALSPNVEQYLVSIAPSGRRELTPAEVAAIQALPGEGYLVDLESALLDLTLHYHFTDHWSAYAIASAISYQGGFLDPTIESFHDTFGFSTFGRTALRRDQVNVIYNLKSAHYVSLGTPTQGGFTDPTVGLRYTGWNLGDHWHLSMEAAMKIGIDGRRTLLSTGRSDYGFQASLQKRGDQHALYIDAAAVYFAGGTFPIPQDQQVIPTLILGYEKAVTAHTNINLQGYASTSVMKHQQTDIPDLLKEKYQLTLGVRHRRENVVYSFGITENLQNINNTPDIGFQLGFAYVPAFAAIP
jgi:hypothetical protein